MSRAETTDGQIRLMAVDEAIVFRVPSMRYAFHRDDQIIDQKCPKCGSPVVCVYNDLGAVDYYDNYAHICLNPRCDFVLHHESFSCNIGGRAEILNETCFFCKRPIRLTS